MKTGRWSKDETDKLKELYESDVHLDDICKILNRDKKSVLNKIYHYGLTRKG